MPRVAGFALPENEQAAARAIESCLMQLSMTVREFRAAMELFLFTRPLSRQAEDPYSRGIVSQWPNLGARVGALCLYDFWMGTQAINKKLLGRCPSAVQLIDLTAKKRAQARLQEAFPNFIKVRQGAAHPAEINDTPEKLAANAVPANSFDPSIISGTAEATVTVQGSLFNDQYVHTIDGMTVSYEVSIKSADVLTEVCELWKTAFQPIEKANREAQHGRGSPPRRTADQNDRQ